MVPSFPEPVTESVTVAPIAGALLASPPPGIPEDLLDPDILASLYSFLTVKVKDFVSSITLLFQKIREGWCLYSALWELEDSFCI